MAVYGAITRPVVDERTPLAAVDAYGRSKVEGERLAGDWGMQSGRAAVSIRLPGVIGTGSHDNFLSNALRQILAGRTIVARNPDSLFNNVVHVSDLAHFVTGLVPGMPAGHSALTVAADSPMRFTDVLALLAGRTGMPLSVDWQAGGKPSFLIGFTAASALGYRAATVEDSISRFAAQVAEGSPA
jgi:nucleoside-diphosphate-sugar epimerase